MQDDMDYECRVGGSCMCCNQYNEIEKDEDNDNE